MKKFALIATLLALIVASFTAPSFAAEGCDPNLDYLAIGHEQLENEDFNGALHRANCGLSFGYNNRDFYYLRADVYCDMGNAEASIADFTTVIELDPTADAYNYRGWAYYMDGDLNAAMSDYNRAIAMNPDLHYAYNNRGLAWQAMGYLELARADYEKAIELGMVENWAESNLYNVNFEMDKLNES